MGEIKLTAKQRACLYSAVLATEKGEHIDPWAHGSTTIATLKRHGHDRHPQTARLHRGRRRCRPRGLPVDGLWPGVVRSMIPSRRRATWRLPPLPVCGGCGHVTGAGVSEYRSMSARLCASCHREVMLSVLCAPAPIEPEVSALVNEMRA